MTQQKNDFVLFYSNNSIYSNFYPAKFSDTKLMRKIPETSIFCDDKEFEFEHVEQYMHACKALIFGDITVLDQILSTNDPKEVKKLGRQVANFDDAVWTEVARNRVLSKICSLI